MSQDKRQRGRPKKSDFVNDNTSNQDSDSDLKAYQRKEEPISETKNVNNDIDSEILQEINNTEGIQNDIPDEEFTPLSEPVKQRSYTSGDGGINNIQQPQGNPDLVNNPQVVYTQDKIIDEPVYTNIGHTKTPDVDDSLLNASSAQEEQKQNKQSQPKNTNNNNNNNSSGNNNSESSVNKQNDIPEETKSTRSPAEKRADAIKTADGILDAYAAFSPEIFGFFAKHNIKKLEKLHKQNEIDIEKPITRDGRNFKTIALEFNAAVDQNFAVTEPERETLREPLIDVLMEKEIALTPTQRLLTAAATVIIPKVIGVIRLNMQKQEDLKEMREMHQQYLETQYQTQELLRRQQQQSVSQQPVTQTQNNTPNQNQQSENVKIVDMTQQNNNPASANNNVQIIPTIDDALNDDLEDNSKLNDDDEDDDVVTDFTQTEEEQEEGQNDIPD